MKPYLLILLIIIIAGGVFFAVRKNPTQDHLAPPTETAGSSTASEQPPTTHVGVSATSGGTSNPPPSGPRAISWPEAKSLVQTCKVKVGFQTHDRSVKLTLTDGSVVTSVADMLDELPRLAQSVESKCGKIPIATE